ncbi:major facilitator superfamily domain-containing protein [Cordyceps javanica]|nr:major facilitator superfamily domain-containing protein [Cordyceps javanica]
MASTQTATTTIHLKDYDSASTSAPVITGVEAGRDAALSTKTTTRRRVAQPPPPANAADDDDAAIIEASRALDEACPDGGYGWIIVLSGAMLMWWASGTTYAWGVVQRKLVEQGLAGPATLSFIGSLQASMPAWFAVLDAFVMRRWLGSRKLAMLGMFTMGLGGILASFCTESIPGLFVTFGFLAGAGGSCGFAVVAAVPSQYFNTRRGLANGLIFAGSGFGGATNSFFMDALIRNLGIAWAFRVLGLVTIATGLFAGWFMTERTKIPDKRFVDIQRVSVVMGMIMTAWAGGYLLGSPIAGYLLEAFGGASGGLKAYRPAMFYAGGLALISAILLGIVRFRINKKFLAAV